MKSRKAPSKTSKNEPIVIRLSRSDREVLAMTAALFDTDLAGYAKQLLRKQVREILRQSPTIHLSQRDFRTFLKMCDGPENQAWLCDGPSSSASVRSRVALYNLIASQACAAVVSKDAG